MTGYSHEILIYSILIERIEKTNNILPAFQFFFLVFSPFRPFFGKKGENTKQKKLNMNL